MPKSDEIPDWFIPGFISGPAKFVREKFVLPFRPKEPPVYYHRRFERVPTIDQCELYDPVCRYEAQEQFLRDKAVDMMIIKILTRRLTHCCIYWGDSSSVRKCQKEKNDKEQAMINYATKYGDVSSHGDVVDYFMKQKHRMIWLRRRRENGEPDAQYND